MTVGSVTADTSMRAFYKERRFIYVCGASQIHLVTDVFRLVDQMCI